MIAARYKLPVKEFPRTARAWRTPYFTLKAQKNSLGYHRVAVIIGAHAVPSSVRRHFWKRRMYDMVKSWSTAAPAAPATRTGWDILITASAKLRELTPATLAAELEKTRRLASIF